MTNIKWGEGMKIAFNVYERMDPDKLAEFFRLLYGYMDSNSGNKINIQGMTLYIPLRDEDGDTVTLDDGGNEVWWEVRSVPRKKEGSERYLVASSDGVYIYRHVKAEG